MLLMRHCCLIKLVVLVRWQRLPVFQTSDEGLPIFRDGHESEVSGSHPVMRSRGWRHVIVLILEDIVSGN